LSKKTSEQVPDDTSNGMTGEDIEGIIIAEYEFELSGKIAQGSGKDTVKHSSGLKNPGSALTLKPLDPIGLTRTNET
jgi:hypothetical protein